MEPITIRLPSGLFPFTLEDLTDFRYRGYRLTNVYQTISASQQQACVELWLRNSAITRPKVAWERSRQVCYMLSLADGDDLIGVNTLYIDRLTRDGPQYYFNRMFIDPGFRNSRLMIVATAATICFARQKLAGKGLPGILNINENQKLGKQGMRRIFERLGYRWQGKKDGRGVWYFEFANVRLIEPG